MTKLSKMENQAAKFASAAKKLPMIHSFLHVTAREVADSYMLAV